MAGHRLLKTIAVAGAAAAAVLAYRRRPGPRRRVDLYYDDGSMVTLPEGSPQAERLLAIAHDALYLAR